MKIYHTETQEDYDALMVELERLGIGALEKHYWKTYDNQTVVFVRAIGRYGDSDRTDTTFSSLGWALKNYSVVLITKYKAKADEKLVNSTQGKSVVRESVSYLIDNKVIRVDSVIKYREKGKDWVRGLIKFVDRDRIKVVRSYGTNHSFSATDIGTGNVEIDVEIY